jgi:formyl-CoA transferase
VERREHLDGLVRDWIAQRSVTECVETMARLEVVASPIYSVEDILKDETFRERGNVVEVEDPDLGPVRMQGVIPRMTNHPGEVWRTAPALGEDNDRVYGEYLGKSADDIAALSSAGTI